MARSNDQRKAVTMKQTPDERDVRERMAPGVLSREGFLGTDTRRVSEIVEADAATLARLGTTCESLAERLRRALEAALAGLGAPVPTGGGVTATWHEAMGRIPCPFGRCGTFPKGEVELADSASGEKVVFTPLSVHLIERHGFFQGAGSRYRLDPALLVRLLPQ